MSGRGPEKHGRAVRRGRAETDVSNRVRSAATTRRDQAGKAEQGGGARGRDGLGMKPAINWPPSTSSPEME